MSEEVSGPTLTGFIEQEILPLIPEKLLQFDKTLDKAGFPPRKYILYGSVAKGTPHRSSDVDIGVVIDSYEGVSVSKFYDLLGKRGALCRIKDVHIELTLFTEDVLKTPFFKDHREIDIENIRETAKTKE